MFVNVDCPSGELKVEILDKNNKVIDDLSADKCKAVSIDSTIQQIEWNGSSDLSSLVGQEVKFRFKLKNGDLYAFWVSLSTNGESNGYVAGGGPGYISNKDTEGKKHMNKQVVSKILINVIETFKETAGQIINLISILHEKATGKQSITLWLLSYVT